VYADSSQLSRSGEIPAEAISRKRDFLTSAGLGSAFVFLLGTMTLLAIPELLRRAGDAAQPKKAAPGDLVESRPEHELIGDRYIASREALRALQAIQQELGMSDDDFDRILKDDWTRQNPNCPSPWTHRFARGGDWWRDNVLWDIERVGTAMREQTKTADDPIKDGSQPTTPR
jgi:hypothetical protein